MSEIKQVLLQTRPFFRQVFMAKKDTLDKVLAVFHMAKTEGKKKVLNLQSSFNKKLGTSDPSISNFLTR